MDVGPHPKRLESERFRVTQEDIELDPANGLELALVGKLAAEAERLLRLAGPAPEGFMWETEQQALKNGWGGMVFRVVVQLKEIP